MKGLQTYQDGARRETRATTGKRGKTYNKLAKDLIKRYRANVKKGSL